MSGLYNLLFGKTPYSEVLLAVLSLSAAKVPRFRDVYVDDSFRIVVHTRTGGINRDFYQNEASCREHYAKYYKGVTPLYAGPWNEDIAKNPHYLFDEDCGADGTYAEFYFKFPEEYAEDLKAFAESRQGFSPSLNWNRLLETLEGEKK